MVTFDQQRQIVSASATIDSHTDDGEKMSVTSDLSRLYSGQVRNYERSYALIDGDRCVITDDIAMQIQTSK